MPGGGRGWFYVSTVVAVTLLIVAYAALTTGALTESPITCHILAFLPWGVALAAILVFAVTRVGLGSLLAIVGIHALSMVFYYAVLYQGYGLKYGEAESFPILFDALYFSVVTWTTLGYGDFQPGEKIRLVAAMQAVLGYVYLGLFVALIADAITVRRASS